MHTLSSGLVGDLSETLLCLSECLSGSPSRGLQRLQLTRQPQLKIMDPALAPPALIPIALKASMCADSLCFSDPDEVHEFCPLWLFLRSGLAVPKAVARKPLPQKVSALDPSIRKQRPERGARYGCGRRKRRVVQDASPSDSKHENKPRAKGLFTASRKHQRAQACFNSNN